MTSPFIPTYRQFPVSDESNLEKQLVNSYVQTATAVNQRTIGVFDLSQDAGNTTIINPQIPNGERWFPTVAQSGTPQKLRDGFRVVVQVDDSRLIVDHGITLINQATRLYGTFFDGTVWWPLPYIDVTAANNQINISVSATQIIVTKGGGAPPAINLGLIVCEFL